MNDLTNLMLSLLPSGCTISVPSQDSCHSFSGIQEGLLDQLGLGLGQKVQVDLIVAGYSCNWSSISSTMQEGSSSVIKDENHGDYRIESLEEYENIIRMVFSSEQEAKSFFNGYARMKGFSTLD